MNITALRSRSECLAPDLRSLFLHIHSSFGGAKENKGEENKSYLYPSATEGFATHLWFPWGQGQTCPLWVSRAWPHDQHIVGLNKCLLKGTELGWLNMFADILTHIQTKVIPLCSFISLFNHCVPSSDQANKRQGTLNILWPTAGLKTKILEIWLAGLSGLSHLAAGPEAREARPSDTYRVRPRALLSGPQPHYDSIWPRLALFNTTQRRGSSVTNEGQELSRQGKPNKQMKNTQE